MKYFSALFLILLLSACKSDEWKIVEMESPAGPGSGEPFLERAGETVWMSWLEKTTSGHALKVAKWKGDWSEPRTIVSDVSFFVNWADFPSVMPLSENRLVAHWLEKKGEGTYAYFVMTSISEDQGKTWSTPVPAHSDRSSTEHGFASFIREDDGKYSIVWLDARNFKGETEHDPMNAMSLMFANGGITGMQNETALDPRVCDCCQTAAVRTGSGVFVAYRDRSEKEIRDISYIRFTNGQWSQPKTLHPDGWHIEGCPVNGPAVDASGDEVVVAWYTGANDQGRVRVAFSTNNGERFNAPVVVDDGNPSGRVDVVLLEDGSSIVSWLENVNDKGAAIRMRQVFPDGRRMQSITVADTSQARASGFPRMARAGQDILIAWTYAGDPQQVRMARIVR